MHYVLGYQFNSEATRVALVKKARPIFQFGLWNGIGGGVERGESVYSAMLREFNEETGQEQSGVRWREYARLLTWTGHTVSCFSSFTHQVEFVRTVTDEEIAVFDLKGEAFLGLRMEGLLVANVVWLVEAALSMRGSRVGGDGRESSSLLTIVEQPPLGAPPC